MFQSYVPIMEMYILHEVGINHPMTISSYSETAHTAPKNMRNQGSRDLKNKQLEYSDFV